MSMHPTMNPTMSLTMKQDEAHDRVQATTGWRARIERAGGVLRRIIGVPDYDRYLAHMRASHAGERALTRDEFAHERLCDRYNRPGTRCC